MNDGTLQGKLRQSYNPQMNKSYKPKIDAMRGSVDNNQELVAALDGLRKGYKTTQMSS